MSVSEAELGVFPRDHRPLVLFEKVMTIGRITTDENRVAGEGALVQQFSATIFSEDNLHRLGFRLLGLGCSALRFEYELLFIDQGIALGLGHNLLRLGYGMDQEAFITCTLHPTRFTLTLLPEAE